MELRHLRYFVAVAEELHFGRAAQRLNVSQPPLSRQIRDLEREVGATLLHRTRREVRLTEPGRHFLAEARRTLQHADVAVASALRAARGEVGALQLGFTSIIGETLLPRLLPAVRAVLPDVQLRLHRLCSADQVDALTRGTIDFGLMRLPASHPSLVVAPLLRETVAVALPRRHRLSRAARVPLDAIANESYVQFDRSYAPNDYDLVAGLRGSAGVNVRATVAAIDLPTTLALVAAGYGLSLLPGSVADLRPAGVVLRPLDCTDTVFESAIAFRRGERCETVTRLAEVVRGAVERDDAPLRRSRPRSEPNSKSRI